MKRLAILGVMVVLVAGACGGSDDDMPRRVAEPAAEPTLTDLTSVDQLRERFNADRGMPRLIVLVAPT